MKKALSLILAVLKYPPWYSLKNFLCFRASTQRGYFKPCLGCCYLLEELLQKIGHLLLAVHVFPVGEEGVDCGVCQRMEDQRFKELGVDGDGVGANQSALVNLLPYPQRGLYPRRAKTKSVPLTPH